MNQYQDKRQRRKLLLYMMCLICRQGVVTALRSNGFLRRKRSLSKIQMSSSHHDSGLVLPSYPNLTLKSVMAPMVAASDYPFRYFLQKHCGVDLTYTQMLHCKNFVTDPKFRLSHLDLWETGVKYPELLPSQIGCLGELPIPDGPSAPEEPLIVQLAGNDPVQVVEGAQMIMEHTEGKVAGFDLNCGCPQAIARKGTYGAFLMEEDADKVCEILSALRNAMPSSTAVSAKIRLPTNDQELKERIPKLLDSGIDFLTVHGRTIHENKTKVGACHVDRIRLAVELAHSYNANFPVVANGGMENYNDVQSILESTGAVAAMSSEALLENPEIFVDQEERTPRERLQKQLAFARDYLDVCATVAPPLPGVLGLKKGGSFNVIRGHLFKFLYRYLNEHIDLRDRLAMERSLQTIDQAREIVDELEARYLNLSDEELLACQSTSPESSWYRRHRKPDRRVHQKEVRVNSSLLGSNEELTIEQRKQQIKARIEKMKERKRSRNANTI